MNDSAAPTSQSGQTDTDSAHRPSFSVIVPVFDSLPYLTDCLNSVRAASERGAREIEVIAVDNGSTDGSYESLTTTYGSWVHVERFRERNIAAVRNHGAQLARGRFLCFLDSDVVIPRDYFDRAEETLVAHGADATGCEVTVPSPASWIEETWAALHRPRGDGPVHYINSANFIVRADAFRAIGGFDRSLTTGEDAEIGQRLNQQGYRIYQARTVSAVHLRNPRTLRAFARKQFWHGLGMFGTVGGASVDKPVAMTMLHALLCVVGAVGLAFRVWPFPARVVFAGVCSLLAPAAAVLYRYSRTGATGLRPLRALVLYHVYFDTRAAALAWILVRKALRR